MDKVKSKVPKLRFPEFDDSWSEKRFDKVFDIKYGKDYRKLGVGNIPVLGSGGIMTYVNEYIYDKPSVLIGRKGSIAKPKYIDVKFWTVDTLFYTEIKEGYLPYFLYLVVSNVNLLKYSEATGVPSLNTTAINGIKKFFPSLKEQQKIASFLSAVDDKIQQLTKKKELLEKYKKGVMQKIFSQEIRFKDDDGNDYPDWEKKKLGDICKITTGKLDANAMITNGQYRFYTCAKEYYRIDDYAFDTEALLVSGNGANVGYIHYYNGKFNAYQRTYVMDKFEECIVFIKYLLDRFLKKRIFQEKNEGNTPYITMGTLTDLQILLPSINEQQKIADFLTSIDKKIDFVNTQLEKTKEFKKGLLQQMFV